MYTAAVLTFPKNKPLRHVSARQYIMFLLFERNVAAPVLRSPRTPCNTISDARIAAGNIISSKTYSVMAAAEHRADPTPFWRVEARFRVTRRSFSTARPCPVTSRRGGVPLIYFVTDPNRVYETGVFMARETPSEKKSRQRVFDRVQNGFAARPCRFVRCVPRCSRRVGVPYEILSRTPNGNAFRM